MSPSSSGIPVDVTGVGPVITPPPTDGFTLGELLERVRRGTRISTDPFDVPTLSATGYTLLEMRDRVRSVIRDQDADFIPDTEIDGWLNDGLLALAERTRSVRVDLEGTIADGVVALPQDYLGRIKLEVDGAPTDFTDDERWNDWAYSGLTPPRRMARVFGANIELYPVPDEGTPFDLRYVARPAVLEGDGDQSTLPKPLQARAIAYAQWQGKLKALDFYSASGYQAIYEGSMPPEAEGISPAPQIVQRAKPNVPMAPEPPRAITTPEIIDWLNDAIRQLAHRTRTVQGKATGTTDGTLNIPLPPQYVQAITLRIGTDDVQFADDDTWYSLSDDAVSTSRSLAKIFQGKIELYPTPAAGAAYELRYYWRPAPLTELTDQPVIPEEIQLKAVAFALAKAKLIEQDFAAHDRYMAEFERGLPTADVQERTRPGPIDLIPSPGPFDTADARHI